MMKKLLMMVLALCLCMTVCASALAVELNKNTLEGSTNISMKIDHDQNSFVVVIPASVTIDPETKTGEFDITLESDWKLISSNSLNVRIKEFANGTTGASYVNATTYFLLKNSKGDQARYTIRCKTPGASAYGNMFDNNYNPWRTTDLISVSKNSSNEEDRTASLKLEVETLPTSPGEYTDVITFAVVLE